MSPDADENRTHSPHSPHSSLSFPYQPRLSPQSVASRLRLDFPSTRQPSPLSSLPSPLSPALLLHPHALYIPISPSRHRIYDLSHRGRCASLHYGPTHPYRVIKSRPEFTSRCSPSNTPPARVTPRSTRELRCQGPADTPHGDTTRVSYQKTSSELFSWPMISASCLPFSRYPMPTRSLDCILGLGSCRWLDPAQVSANPAVQARLVCLRCPKPCISFLVWGKALI
jgi:hypothetical protein